MAGNDGFDIAQDKEYEERATYLINTGMTENAGFESVNDKGIEELEAENMLLKIFLGDLHKSIKERKGNPITKSWTIKTDPSTYVQLQQIQEIYNNFKQMERDIKRFKDENNCLERLLSYLHKGITTGTEASSMSFVLPSEIPSDSAVASSYKMARDIWNKFMKMNGSNKTLKDTNKQLSTYAEDIKRALSQEKETVSEQRKRITSLQSDIESKTTVNKQLQSAYENLQRTNDRNMSHEKEKVSHQSKRVQSLILELESRDAVNKQLQEDCQALQRRIEELSDEMEQFKKNFQIQRDLNRAVDEKWKLDRELLQKYDASIKIMEQQMATLQKREVYYKAAYDAEVMKTESQKKEIDGLQEQRDELSNRLSKIARERLTHENTNISDLNDANRPIKLAENYSELYDNEWTDAFGELISRNLTGKAAVGKLLDMIMVSFRKCREITWGRYQLLKSILSTIDIHILACARGSLEAHNSDFGSCDGNKESEIVYYRTEEGDFTPQSKGEHHTCTTTMTLDQEHKLKRIWRTTTTALQDEVVKHLHSVLVTRFDISIDEFPKTSKYLAICIELCWKMGVQERPMHLDAVAETENGSEKILDRNKFNPYTKSGKMVSFVVWPALFSHEGGAMLVKGIAQGCKETD
ncbi:hypothetical protein CHS0354_018278 [Potamilus streckersoni]|uniref:Mitochondria-eating protein C-terminal domain-containing protein n=1 Tax=Potamilus streckersoni TaxID=2493646 RepID=A0AAE0RQB5_9BIVA|nr:hypothetical protein CHS0354_018278 [Potamilus streckersoni]